MSNWLIKLNSYHLFLPSYNRKKKQNTKKNEIKRKTNNNNQNKNKNNIKIKKFENTLNKIR
jgi:hypothetical protein